MMVPKVFSATENRSLSIHLYFTYLRQLSPKAEAEFGFASVPLLSFEDLYAGNTMENAKPESYGQDKTSKSYNQT